MGKLLSGSLKRSWPVGQFPWPPVGIRSGTRKADIRANRRSEEVFGKGIFIGPSLIFDPAR
jgi:hypothetical protein